MSFVFFTSIEILVSFLLILEIKNKDKLINFEEKMLRKIRSRIRNRLCGEKVCRVCNVSQEFKKSA